MTPQYVAIILPNDDQKQKKVDSQEYYIAQLASIQSLEQLVGFEFFPGLSKTATTALAKNKAANIWALGPLSQSRLCYFDWSKWAELLQNTRVPRSQPLLYSP